MSTEVPGTPQEPTPASPQGQASATPSKDERTWAMLAHLSGIIFYFLGPLVIWLIQKDQMPFVNDQAREALNFQITLVIAWAAALVLSFVGVRLLLYPALVVLNIVFCIMGGIKANEGVAYRYPVALRLVS